MNIEEIVSRIKRETDNIGDIIYRKKTIGKKNIYIIFNEPLNSSDKISDFIVRSLTNINNSKPSKNIIDDIKENISNFKYKELKDYKSLCSYLHKGFTIILIEDEEIFLALETKADLARSISTPDTENTIRGAKDAFVEDYQRNIGLIKKRIKTNDLRIKNLSIGKYTDTQVGVLSINGIVKQELVDQVIEKIERIDIDGIVNIGTIKNLIEKENKLLLPTIITTERPDLVCNALLEGKVVIVIDNSPYVLIVPGVFNDFFKTSEDFYGKSVNVSFTRILKYITFFIALLTPALYIAAITYNQEMIPTELLISFSTQRDGVPFPAFFETFIMMIAFEILRESDMRIPGFTGNSLSIVGALILGEAAVSAGIVSPILIIIVALTAISSLAFSEVEIVNALRIYRIIFMIGASFMGIIGVVVVFIYFVIKLVSTESFGKPYLITYTPLSINSLKDSIIKLKQKKQDSRNEYLSDNTTKQRID